MRRRTVHGFVLGGGLLALASLVAAEPSWLLRLSGEEGQTQRFAVRQTQDMDIDMGAMGRQKVRNGSDTEFLQTIRERLPDGALVIDVVFGPMRSRMAFGAMEMEFDSEGSGDGSHPLARLQQLLKGKSFSATLTPRGEVRSIDGLDELFDGVAEAFADRPGMGEALDALAPAFKAASVETLMQHAVPPYPEQAVGPGQTWRESSRVSNPALGGLVLTQEFTLEGAERKRGRDCLRIGVTSAIEFEGDSPMAGPIGALTGVDVSIDVGDAAGSGTLWIDPDRGWVVESKVRQQIEMDLSMRAAQGEGEAAGSAVEMHASMTQEVEVELLDPVAPGTQREPD
jgi:hypothetical protein